MTEEEKKFAEKVDAKIAARKAYLHKQRSKVASCENQIRMYETKKQEYLDDIAVKEANLFQMESSRERALAAAAELAELRPKLAALTAKLSAESKWMPGDDDSLLPINNPQRVEMVNRIKDLEKVTMEAAMDDVNRIYFGKG